MRVVIGGITANATEEWLINILKSWTDGFCPLGQDAKFLVRDRDRRFTPKVDWYLACGGSMGHSALLRKSHESNDVFKKVIETLYEAGNIDIDIDRGKTKPSKIYRLILR